MAKARTVHRCTECGAEVKRVFHPPAVHFKGSGFYNTDYGRKRGGGSSETDGSNGGDGQWVDQTQDHSEDEKQAQGSEVLAEPGGQAHQRIPYKLGMNCTMRSMSLIPTKGAIMPPTP